MSLYSRRRVSQGDVVPTFATQSHQYVWYPFQDSQTYETGFTGTRTEILDNNNAGWKIAQQRGFVTMSNVHLSRSTRAFTPGSLSAKTNVWAGQFSGDIVYRLQGGPDHVLPTMIVGDSSQVLLMKAYAKMNQSNLMSGEILSDLGKTVSMLRRPFSNATKLLAKIQKAYGRNRKSLGRATGAIHASENAFKALSSAWLEYRYGWKPLMMDAEEAFKQFHHKWDASEVRLVARSASSSSGSSSGSWPDTFDREHNYASGGTMSHSFKGRHSAGVIYDVKHRENSEQLAARLGTRARDLPATLWEITPYSFVLDWFLNVGDWLEAITPNPGVVPLGHWYTWVQTDVTTRGGRSQAPETMSPGSTFWAGSYGSETLTTFNYKRTCNQPLESHPVWTRKPLSRLHQVDGLALSCKNIVSALKQLKH